MTFCNECRRMVADDFVEVISVASNGLKRKACGDCAAKIKKYRKQAKKTFDRLMTKT